MQKYQIIEYFVIALLCVASILLIGLQIKSIGFIIFFLGILLLFLCKKEFIKYIILLFASIFILSITPISSDISWQHIFVMFIGVSMALGIPYFVSRFIYKDHFIQFPIFQFKKLSKQNIKYVLVSTVVMYGLFTIYFLSTHAYQNWPVHGDFSSLFRLFWGIMIVGLWDELMFIGTFLRVINKFLPFKFANAAQAVVFSSFLYQMGFRSWGYVLIFVVVFLHALTFKKTNSLSYLFIVHTVVDVVLFSLLLLYGL